MQASIKLRCAAALLSVGLFAIQVTLIAEPAQATAFTVTRSDDPTPDGCQPNDCSLREAIIRANAEDGPDSITLDEPVTLALAGASEDAAATGDLDITEAVTIDGSARDTVIINGAGLDRIFHVRPGAAGVVLKELTVTNGLTPENPPLGSPLGGGGILAQAKLRLQDVKVSDNTDGQSGGGGIRSTGALTLVDVVVQNNKVDALGGVGGGVSQTGSTLTVTDSRFTQNEADVGAGLRTENATAAFTDSRIDHNDRDGLEGPSGATGGGISSIGGTVDLTETTVDFNLGSTGGGIHAADATEITLRDSKVADNEATSGGGIANQGASTVNLSSTEVARNKATTCCGGGIFSIGASVLTVNRSAFSGNTSVGCCGGAVYSTSGSKTTIGGSTFLKNEVGTHGGGAFYVEGAATRFTLRGSTVKESKAGETGGAILISDGQATIDRSKILQNRSNSNGGGIYVQNSKLTLRNSLVKGNQALGDQGFGGGIFTDENSTSTISGSTFQGNKSEKLGGGLFFRADGKGSLVNSTVSGNTGGTGTGGLFISVSGEVRLEHVTIFGNQVGSGTSDTTGGVRTNGGTITVTKSIIAKNEGSQCLVKLAASGVNMDSDSTCFAGGASLHGDPKILALANNGGPTPTHALRATSRAVDAVPGAACPPPSKDQRGIKRPQNGDGEGNARCDLGAYEHKP